MALTINTNVSALTAQRNLSGAASRSASSLSKLSSGSRVPTAKEDAASLSIGTGLKLDVAAFKAAQTNAQQASSLLQIADGAFSQIGDILARMKTLATTGLSDQLSNTERDFLDTEFDQLLSEVDRIASATEFNGTSLLSTTQGLELNAAGAELSATNGIVGFGFDPSVNTAHTFEIGFDLDGGGAGVHHLTVRNNDTNQSQTLVVAAPSAGSTTEVDFGNLGVQVTFNDQFTAAGTTFNADANSPLTAAGDADYQFNAQAVAGAAPATTLNFQVGIGTNAVVDQISFTVQTGTVADLGLTGQQVDTTTNAGNASTAIDGAVETVNTARATIGATLNRLEFASSNLAVSIENTEAARSVLLDVDVSAEITKFTSEQVLIQAGVSLLAQANQQPGLLLRLLQ